MGSLCSDAFVHSSGSEGDQGESPVLPKRVARRRSHIASTALGISSKEYRRMRRWKVPALFMHILAMLHSIEGWVHSVRVVAKKRIDNVLPCFSQSDCYDGSETITEHDF